ncbi:RagB/SusD family nutrient uptake outer membrane protein [Pedobacter sp. B4-66]|uniref:RagB/SusD family nutrient uptake outer membrane protein n=1 Tax=Pedobacter sp. B4-66 TaxID=2817280 RepID=UPI001BDA1A09|nr:RagB/SusD family nutrient uptake outer membrane protein [Pedobacter sp. B4-66]
MKRNNILFIIGGVFMLSLGACTKFLDVEPKDRLSGNALFASNEGVEAYLAGLYNKLPIEDFRFDYRTGFNYGGNSGGMISANATQDVIHSEWGDHLGQTDKLNYWDAGYKYIREVNDLKSAIPTMNFTDEKRYNQLKGEAHFFLAYTYYQLAKRYGGVPLVLASQEYRGEIDKLKLPRSTEVETWKYVLAQCDSAALLLPDNNGKKATKWVALALKSRAALHAASVGKFWDEAALTGEAVSKKFVGGMGTQDVQFFYQECINASAEIMRSGKFNLYKPEPSTLDEAAENYRMVFNQAQNASPEIIFSKGYTYPGVAHSMGTWHQPNQLSKEYAGRANITLDLVDAYEYISSSGIGSGAASANIKTRIDKNEDYSGYQNGSAASFIKYATPTDIFKGKDPRLSASVILPGSNWKNTNIVIQGGIVKADGSSIWLANDPYTFDGKTYYGKGNGSESLYSGWVGNRSNGTITGFLLKKYLSDGDDQTQNQVTTEFPDMRFAEVLLNYAEAVVESGLPTPPNVIDAKTALNKTRHRAGFKDDLELTSKNVQQERRVEMAIEYTRIWDLMRRREFHKIFNGNFQRHALVPMLDFTETPAKYIFVRYTIPEPGGAKWFETKAYYRPIPGIEGNSLTQNPNY